MDHITFIPGSSSPTRVRVGLCDLADDDTIVLRNVSNNLPFDASSHLRRLESAAIVLRALQILQVCINYIPERQHLSRTVHNVIQIKVLTNYHGQIRCFCGDDCKNNSLYGRDLSSCGDYLTMLGRKLPSLSAGRRNFCGYR